MFGDEIIPIKSPRWILILAATYNISENSHRLAHRRYPLGHAEKYV